MKRPKPLHDAPFGVENQLRKHYFLERYVIMAPERGLRPDSYSRHDARHKQKNRKSCPLCADNHEQTLYRRPASGAWQVKVVPNKYPVLTLDNPEAYGAHEIIIETPDHNREFSELNHAEQLNVFAAYRHRLGALSALEGIRYVQIWKNDGPLAGASIAHAHSQVLALPLIPPNVEAENIALDRYRSLNGSCAICDLSAWEEHQAVRIIYSDKHLVVVAPYAASAPFGAWLIPRRHEGSFSNLTSGELSSLATALGKLASRLDHASMSFNWFLVNSLPHEDHHFVLKVEPRDTTWGGAELGTGIITNPVPPEYAALWYQGKV
jgi:UDPglucose--hexose-1-phosphate uridylyltransferase